MPIDGSDIIKIKQFLANPEFILSNLIILCYLFIYVTKFIFVVKNINVLFNNCLVASQYNFYIYIFI